MTRLKALSLRPSKQAQMYSTYDTAVRHPKLLSMLKQMVLATKPRHSTHKTHCSNDESQYSKRHVRTDINMYSLVEGSHRQTKHEASHIASEHKYMN